MASSSQNIQVAVRCRPLNDKELKASSSSVIECNEKRKEVIAFDRNTHVANCKTFTFDKVFGCESKQSDVYSQVVRPVVSEVIEGYNCTIFAYGQTGTGKTYTMEGYRSVESDTISWDDDPEVGIIPRAVSQLYSTLNSFSNCEYSIKVSFIELYNEELTDLLSDKSLDKDEKLRIYEDPNRKGSVIIPNLEEKLAPNKNEVYKILQKGAERRQTAATFMNAQSSRSHSIFTLTVFIKEKAIGDGEERIKVGKLNLVDLAGSENIERSGATGKRATEAGKINKSLTTLGRVITALVEFRDHIPYRESNLTRLLQDSLGGKTKTTIIATISPAFCNIEETLSTLDYAHKAKSIRNKPEINQKLVKKTLIKEYTEEIEKLKRELHAMREKTGVYLPQDMYDSFIAQNDSRKDEIRDLSQKIGTLSEQLESVKQQLLETKDELSENRDKLYKAESELAHSKFKLDTTERHLAEYKYIATEHLTNEHELFNQAQNLVQLNADAHEDICGLHEKINNLKTVNHNNRELASHFSLSMQDSLRQMNRQETETSSVNKERLCTLCENLHSLCNRVEQSKTSTISRMHLLNSKHENNANALKHLIQNEIETIFFNYYESFLQTMTAQSEQKLARFDNAVQICAEHREAFVKVWKKQKVCLESLEKNNNSILADLGAHTKQVLTLTSDKLSANTSIVLGELDQMSEKDEETGDRKSVV